jgi:hypothetical protein
MAPFLCDAIFNVKSLNPLELIIIAQEAAIEFDAHHCGMAGFANTSATVHANAFANWSLLIRLGKLKEARFTINPDNNELQGFSSLRHANCILPPLGATGLITHGAVGAVGQSRHLDHEVFKSLSKGLKRKKDCIKDMHPSISNMILMVSAVKNDIQGDYVESLKVFYNSKNHGYADMELNQQFDAKGFHNVGFVEGTVLALWLGLLKRSNPTASNNCTPFGFQEFQPANMNQKSRSLICTMINQKGGLAQSAEEIKTKVKQDVAAPADYNTMIFQLRVFAALIEILLSKESIAFKQVGKSSSLSSR